MQRRIEKGNPVKSNLILQITVLTALLLLSVAGAPVPSAVHTAHVQSLLQPQDGATVVADKSVSQAQANWGDILAYTITLTNTSVVSPFATLLTDTLPLSLAFQPGSLSASEGTITHTAQVIHWSGVITASGVVTISLQAQVLQPNTTITNAAVFDAGEGPVLSPVATTTVGLAHLYLPMVTQPEPGIYGIVTQNGGPASGMPLELRFYNGSNWSTAANLSTGGDGAYRFTPPALLPGQKYYVRFTNPNTTSDDGRLFRWYTREITAYQPNFAVPIGDFDIANIVYNSPAPGASVGLPFNFQWNARPSTPSDSYEFDLFSTTSNAPSFFTNPPLGYVSSYVLPGLPGGFNPGTTYGWSVVAYSPDGGFGIAYWYYTVTFTNALTGLPSASSAHAGRTADLPATSGAAR